MRIAPRRDGYALVLVVLFSALLLALLAVAYRQTAALYRTATGQAQRVIRDTGTTQALARGIRLLETGSPPSDPYRCATIVNTPTGPRSYTVTFASEGSNAFALQAAPTSAGDNPPSMPTVFLPTH